MKPLMLEITITDALKSPWSLDPASSSGRNATVVKYTDDTSVVYVSPHCSNVSFSHKRALTSVAVSPEGSALVPETPAAVTIGNVQ